MNKHLQKLLQLIQQDNLGEEQKNEAIQFLKDADKELEITAFKLDRTEKVKHTTAILLEETIVELEQKRKSVESQKKELEIEAALERVRSRTLAMHNSDELSETARVLFQQFVDLGESPNRFFIGIVNDEDAYVEIWLTAWGGTIHNKGIKVSIKKPSAFTSIYTAWKANQKSTSVEIKEEDLYKYNEFLKAAGLSIAGRETVHKLVNNVAFFSKGCLGITAGEVLPLETLQLLERFAGVFEQTYTRFLDLQKAEAQAREAKIEAALEKVRSRSLVMHKSDELQELVNTVFDRLNELDIDTDATNIIIFSEGAKDAEFWVANTARTHATSVHIDFVDQLISQDIFHAKENGDAIFSKCYSFEEKNEWYRYAFEHTGLKNIPEERKKIILEAEAYSISMGITRNAGVLVVRFSNNLFTESEHEIIRRLSIVFEQAYVRFLDLQKAEAQAREAQIEASLERVRSRTMAMQRSEELQATALLLFQQILSLGISQLGCGFNIWDDDRKSFTSWMGGGLGENTPVPTFKVPASDDIFLPIREAAERGESLFVREQGGKELEEHYRCMFSLPIWKDIMAGWTPPTFQVLHCAYFSQGFLMFLSKEPVPDAHDIFKRFAKVFEQTYTRFLDLQKAESQAREAIKQASLDRVRGEIASMRSTEDLNRITPLVWKELTAMEVPFIRCGVFIVDESNRSIRAFLSAPDGRSLGVLNLPVNSSDLTIQIMDHWHQQKMYTTHWNREQFLQNMQIIISLGQIQEATEYQGAASPPESVYLHFTYFKQGMLYVGNVEPLSVESIESAQSLADSFAIAFARYEDFKQLEAAKKSVDTALTELRDTQSQLIQSEKMASLGELTAGIAHEIQNPLNFVNNFSEVSKELLEEMRVAIEKGDTEDAQEIMNDVIQNLEKINHHGKRADGIVKGMLQHSRTSAGQKELTDINALCDEYLRLSYHGLRAKDKSFNAKFETHLDATLPKINVIPQDIGRVVLNLINNAFYAVNEKSKREKTEVKGASSHVSPLASGYEPLVIVNTKKVGDKIEISVKDNGNGIPDKIKEKIFQPFFTTKPTGQGTGLGLSLSYDIVKAHAGELKAESKEGEGSKFEIILSLA